MNARAFWRRLDRPGHDAAQVTPDGDGWRLSGAAAFLSPDGPAALAYEVACGPEWITRSGRVRGFVGRRPVDWRIVREDGGWTLNGREVAGLDHCLDLDFGFTPATNFTQTRRISLAVGGRAEVPVAWIDADTEALADAARLLELKQTYVRLSETAYAYDAATTGYRAELQMLSSGFVRLYPDLWEAEAP